MRPKSAPDIFLKLSFSRLQNGLSGTRLSPAEINNQDQTKNA
jgi:hypothetical protein